MTTLASRARRRFFIACAGLSLSWVIVAQAALVTINPINDTTIYQGTDPVSGEVFEDNSCGAGIDLFSGVTNDGFLRRALLKFDIAGSIPPGSTINGVTLTVDVNRSGDNQDATMTLSPLTQLWGEGVVDCRAIRGGGQGAPADPGDATWLDAQFQQVSWTSLGGDFGGESASALIPIRGLGTWDSAANPAMVIDVQGWLDNPGSNNGWIVVGDEGRASTTRRFNSREGGAPPVLSVDFNPAGTVEACCQTDGSCSLTVEGSGDCTGTTLLGVTSCSPNQCPQPVGACCNQDESCSDAVDRTSCEASGGVFQGEASACSDNQVDCGLTPFVDALPIPPALAPTGTNAQGWPQYSVEVVAASQQLHSELPATDVWTYNGAYPSFTIEARSGQPIEVTYANNLPTARGNRGSHLLEVDECSHGPNYYGDSARIVTHLHGGHLPARFDGQPEYTILPGETDVYEYPNNQEAATL
ncbi:MAG: DNRLRE domain-containing protein, partial [Pseudomonadota bacterium]|nr:DNRLRE domain-containing protein [Pseudomonadota bacterium]